MHCEHVHLGSGRSPRLDFIGAGAGTDSTNTTSSSVSSPSASSSSSSSTRRPLSAHFRFPASRVPARGLDAATVSPSTLSHRNASQQGHRSDVEARMGGTGEMTLTPAPFPPSSSSSSMTTTSFIKPCSLANRSARSLRSAAAAAASLGPSCACTAAPPPPSFLPPAGPMAAWYPARLAAASAAAFRGSRVSIPPHPPLCPSL